MKLLEVMQQQEDGHRGDESEAGRITFMPLTQLEARMPASGPMDAVFESRDAKPIIKRLRYDTRFEAAMHQVIISMHVCNRDCL